MKDIAAEFSIKWDSKGFEQKMTKPSTFVQVCPHRVLILLFSIYQKAFSPSFHRHFSVGLQDHSKVKGSYHVSDHKSNLPTVKDMILKEDKHDVFLKERLDINNGYKLHNHKEGAVSKMDKLDLQKRHGHIENGYNSLNCKERTIPRKDGHNVLFQGSQGCVLDKREAFNPKEDAQSKTIKIGSSSLGKSLDYIDVGSQLHSGWENKIPVRDGQGISHGTAPHIADPLVRRNGKEAFGDGKYGSQHAISDSPSKDEVAPKLTPHYRNALPPPYVKSNIKARDRKNDANLGSPDAGFDGKVVHKNSLTNDMLERIQLEHEHPDKERQLAGTARMNGHGLEKDHIIQDEVTSNPIPKPRSTRRRHSKSRSYQADTGNSEDAVVVARRSRSRRRDDSRQGLQTLLSEEHYHDDEEERIIDKLLIHYSKKQSAHEPGKLKRKSKSRHGNHAVNGVGESPQNGRRVGPDEVSEMVPPMRSVSLPRKHTGPSESAKVFTRAASFQPERSDPARHVHPKLPDYDDLAAKFAALRGR